MVRAAERLPVEERLFADVGAQFRGQAGEAAARSLVVRPHRGFEMTNMLQPLRRKSALSMARLTDGRVRVHRDLPDEQDVGPVGQHISGDKTVDASSGAFGQDTGVAEMLSQEQVRVEELRSSGGHSEMRRCRAAPSRGWAGASAASRRKPPAPRREDGGFLCGIDHTTSPDSGGAPPVGTSRMGEAGSTCGSAAAACPSCSIKATMRSSDSVMVACSSSGNAFSASARCFCSGDGASWPVRVRLRSR